MVSKQESYVLINFQEADQNSLIETAGQLSSWCQLQKTLIALGAALGEALGAALGEALGVALGLVEGVHKLWVKADTFKL